MHCSDVCVAVHADDDDEEKDEDDAGEQEEDDDDAVAVAVADNSYFDDCRMRSYVDYPIR
jgi:hypothetical protein